MMPLVTGATTSLRRYGEGLNRSFKLDRAVDRVWFGWKTREALYRHMAVQIENDIAQLAALQSFRRRLLRKKKTGSAKVIGRIASAMENGSSLSASLKNLVPADEALVIMGGEKAGQVGQAFTLILDAKERMTGVRRTMLKAFITPIVYLVALYALLWFIGASILPTITKMIPASSITGLGGLVVTLGTAATSLWMLLPAALLAAAIGWIWWALPNWTSPFRVKMEGYFPFNFYRDLQGYVWTLTFSAMLKAGIPDTQILAEQIKLASPWLKQRLRAVRQRMTDGKSLGDALALTRYEFPSPDLIDDIASIAGFVDFPDRMRRRAIQWSDELQWITTARLKTLGVVFDVVMYGLMGVVIAGINSMSEQIGNVPGLN